VILWSTTGKSIDGDYPSSDDFRGVSAQKSFEAIGQKTGWVFVCFLPAASYQWNTAAISPLSNH
jgi:hypothetical protein